MAHNRTICTSSKLSDGKSRSGFARGCQNELEDIGEDNEAGSQSSADDADSSSQDEDLDLPGGQNEDPAPASEHGTP